MEWRDIRTLEKDNNEPKIGYGVWRGEIHSSGQEAVIDIIGSPATRVDGVADPAGWWDCLTGDAYACWLKPTHWMPLPAPPEES